MGRHVSRTDRQPALRRGVALAVVCALLTTGALAQDDRYARPPVGITGSVAPPSPASSGAPAWSGEPGSSGHPLMQADAIRRGLQGIAHCAIRIVLLHYAPTSDTLHGEPEGIWTYLGSERLATPIAEYRPDVVLHGHAHGGSFEGAIGATPVYNVAVHVTGRDFYIFELDGATTAAAERLGSDP